MCGNKSFTMLMNYPGLPDIWGLSVILVMLIAVAWILLNPAQESSAGPGISGKNWRLGRVPLIGRWFHNMTRSGWPLRLLKVAIAAVFLLIIAAGLSGSQIPQRNIATLFTWNIWWTGVIISVFFMGSAWCAICPWNALANWIVRWRPWATAGESTGLGLRVPRMLRHVWPALLLFIGLSWLELGAGITTNPYATALMALLMVVLASISLMLFRRNAFCRYFCPVGRTIGCYSQLAPIELRPIDSQVCQRCETLDCYYGNERADACPTWLVMGRIQQNTYCTSCGNCSQSCPHDNIDWRLRDPAQEAMQGSRPHWDEAWFMLGLLALTGFHGITMMPFWEQGIRKLAQAIGDSGQLLWSFSIGLLLYLLVVVAFYALVVALMCRISPYKLAFKRVFTSLAFVSLPLAFAYHVAHNLSHLVRESSGIASVILNPFGAHTQPLSMTEMHQRLQHMALSPTALHAIQAALMAAGFWFALQILRRRSQRLLPNRPLTAVILLPMLFFVLTISGFELWLLMQPMIMRM